MIERDDHRLVDRLYDEVSDAEAPPARASLPDEVTRELASLEATLGLIRSIPLAEPPPYLDAKILAEARQVAETATDGHWWTRTKKRWLQPVVGLAVAGATATLAAVVIAPMANLSPPSERYLVQGPEAQVMARPPAASRAASSADKGATPQAEEDMLAGARRTKRKREDPASEGVARARRRAKTMPPDAVPPKARPRPSEPRPRRTSRDLQPGDRAVDTRPKMRAAAPAPAPGGKVGAAESRQALAPPSSVAGAPAPPAAPIDSGAGASGGAAAPVADLPTPVAGADPTSMASAFLEAASQAERADRSEEARRIFKRAVARVPAHPVRGTILLRFAAFELRQKNYAAARRLAKAALAVPGFKRRSAAERVLDAADLPAKGR